jgi:hypothetical protein
MGVFYGGRAAEMKSFVGSQQQSSGQSTLESESGHGHPRCASVEVEWLLRDDLAMLRERVREAKHH